MMDLTTLLQHLISHPLTAILISGITSDSREVKPGDLFIAHAGPKANQSYFIEQAIRKGAVAIVKEAETNISSFETTAGIPIYAIPNLKQQVAKIAARFYQNPSQHLKFIGVTGTNGKTSCSQFIARILEQHNIRCGIIGTLGQGFPDHITPGTLTTPGAIELQRTLADLQTQGADYIAMEVSSHSLAQQRVAGIPFETAIFTNLTRDHLDYHGDMEHYSQAKRLLFLTPGLKNAVINADDAFGQQLLAEFSSQFACYGYSIENSAKSTVYADQLQFHAQSISAHIHSPWGEGILQSPLLGRFNVSNLLATLTTLCLLGLPFPQVLAKLSHLPTVPGRMQCVGGGDQPVVVVDYSHTPDSLEKALLALHEHSQQKIWCVFGCGGNRDKGKRPLMAQIAEKYSDHIIITNDNPRFEDPKTITDEILQGIANPQAVIVERDRRAAIAYAITHAQVGDIILVAGKGHETYQIIGDEKIHFDDVEEVKMALKNLTR
jgi:UDP-N-acetylmuramoyl-L-alanyl-D-glutamate--2,6-diaminopimelate ligase